MGQLELVLLAQGDHHGGLHFMYYNYCRVHQSLKITPVMAAGLTDHIWSIADLVDLIPEPEVAAWGSKSGRKALAET